MFYTGFGVRFIPANIKEKLSNGRGIRFGEEENNTIIILL